MKRLLLLLGILSCWMLSTNEVEAQNFIDTTVESCISTTGGQVTLTFTNPPPASSSVTITFYYRGDLNGTTANPEKFDFFDENSNLLGTSNFQSTQCDPVKDSTVVTVPAVTYNGWLADGQVDIIADADPTVSSTLAACAPWGGSCAQAKVEYTSTTGNCANAFSNFTIDSISGTVAKIDWVPGTGNSSFIWNMARPVLPRVQRPALKLPVLIQPPSPQ
ncbi:MAG: hypothetical protein U5L96_03005 [Owenweeksia sp.]|nr:hypothetical protein [Owenweeksia sp.]